MKKEEEQPGRYGRRACPGETLSSFNSAWEASTLCSSIGYSQLIAPDYDRNSKQLVVISTIHVRIYSNTIYKGHNMLVEHRSVQVSREGGYGVPDS